ncbi:MAG: hypothetical protein R3F19_21460 [Verrucomicrobiales bacterium]
MTRSRILNPIVIALALIGIMGGIFTFLPPDRSAPESRTARLAGKSHSWLPPRENGELILAEAADALARPEFLLEKIEERNVESIAPPKLPAVPEPLHEVRPPVPTTPFSKSKVDQRKSKRRKGDIARHNEILSFAVPSQFETVPPPLFVMEMTTALEQQNESDGTRQNLTAAEQTAIDKAGEMFFDGLTAAPTTEPDSEEYARWWDASRQRSENYLRAMLGWARYNTLSAEAAQTWVRSRAESS